MRLGAGAAVVLEERHCLTGDHGLALLEHLQTVAGRNGVVGHSAGGDDLADGVEEVEHVLGGERVLEIVGERVGQTGRAAEYVDEVRGGDALVRENEAEGAVLGAGLDGGKELLVGPTLGLDLRDVNAGFLEHGLVAAESLDGDVERQTVNGVLKGHVADGVVIVVGEVDVLGDVDGDAHLDVGAESGVGDLGDVGSFAGESHGGELGVMVVPGGLDHFNGDVGVIDLPPRPML